MRKRHCPCTQHMYDHSSTYHWHIYALHVHWKASCTNMHEDTDTGILWECHHSKKNVAKEAKCYTSKLEE